MNLVSAQQGGAPDRRKIRLPVTFDVMLKGGIMRKLMFFCCLALCFVSTCVAYAEGTKRTAVIEDSAGVSTEIIDLDFSGNLNRWFDIYSTGNPLFGIPCIGINTKVFAVAIPIDSLISIEAKNGHATVAYQLSDRTKRLAGALMEGDFIGKSDFGGFRLSTDKLKKLAFKESPVAESKSKAASFTDTLILSDGSRISVANLQRRGWYTSSMDLRTTHTGFTDVRFLRGESESIVDFDKIRKMTFEPDKSVVVILKNGSAITGIIPKQKWLEVKGFTGIYEEGEFYISPESVKAIEFGN